MKIPIIILLLSLQTITFGQASNDTVQALDYYQITEAYIINKDSTFSLHKEYVEHNSGIIFIPLGDRTVMEITRGSM